MPSLPLGGAGSSGPGAFSPLSLSPHVWFKADAGLLDASDVAITVDATAIKTWQDQSGNARHMTQGTSGSRPLAKLNIQNGLPVVRFDGTDDFFQTSSWTGLSQPNTIFIAASMGAPAGKYYIDGIAVNNRHAFGDALLNADNHGIYGGSNTVQAAQARPTGFHIWTCVFNGTSSSIRKDAAAFASGATDIGSNTLTGLTVGAPYTGASGNITGDIAEVILVAGSVSSGSRDSTETYLKTKYGVA